ncbi:MAG: ParB/RepB/Spo0J family partition protein [Gemmatimonadaceae bacterium]|nr:ParB/RepB/Spo0J family partition protein [Gemmatimonadaceae bacterium]
MTAHPAAELFPLMEGAEFQRFVENIRTRGLKHPIVTLDGQILDGRNRERACAEAGVEPRYVEVDLNGDSPVEYVLGENLERRHLTPSQTAVVAEKSIPLFAAEAKERQREHGGTAPGRPKTLEPERAQVSGRARALAAEKFGVADAQVARAIALRKHAPELLTEVEAGRLTIGAAVKKAGLNPSGTPEHSRRPYDKHKAVIAAAESLARLHGKWERSMTDALTPPEAKKQLAVIRKAAAVLADADEAVEYRADTPHTFLGR